MHNFYENPENMCNSRIKQGKIYYNFCYLNAETLFWLKNLYSQNKFSLNKKNKNTYYTNV